MQKDAREHESLVQQKSQIPRAAARKQTIIGAGSRDAQKIGQLLRNRAHSREEVRKSAVEDGESVPIHMSSTELPAVVYERSCSK